MWGGRVCMPRTKRGVPRALRDWEVEPVESSVSVLRVTSVTVTSASAPAHHQCWDLGVGRLILYSPVRLLSLMHHAEARSFDCERGDAETRPLP